jgi:hypothetical protein
LLRRIDHHLNDVPHLDLAAAALAVDRRWRGHGSQVAIAVDGGRRQLRLPVRTLGATLVAELRLQLFEAGLVAHELHLLNEQKTWKNAARRSSRQLR